MKNLKNCKNLKDIEAHVKQCSETDLKNFLSWYAGSCLGSHNYCENTLRDPQDDIPYIRKIFGSAVKVVNSQNCHTSETIVGHCSLLLSHTNKNGFNNPYSKLDIKMIYTYKRLYKDLRVA